MLQPRISAMLKAGKVRPNIETLRRFAEAFDCGLIVRFAPFSELADWSDKFNPDTFDVPSFPEEAVPEEQPTEAPEDFTNAIIQYGQGPRAPAKPKLLVMPNPIARKEVIPRPELINSFRISAEFEQKELANGR